MKQRVTIHTESGSISNRMRIAFTITPQSPSFPNPHKQMPIAHQIMEFWPGEETHQDLEWYTELAFSTCTMKGGKCCVDPQYRIIPPNHFADLTGSNRVYTWTPSRYDGDERRQRENVVTATNRTDGTRFIVLGCISPSSNPNGESFHSFHPLVAYTVRAQGVLCVPVRLELQAYVTQMKDKKNQFLPLPDLKQGLLPAPYACKDTAQGLIWRFSRNPNGGQFSFKEEKVLDDPSEIAELRKSLNETTLAVSGVMDGLKALKSDVQRLESRLGALATQMDSLLREPRQGPSPPRAPQGLPPNLPRNPKAGLYTPEDENAPNDQHRIDGLGNSLDNTNILFPEITKQGFPTAEGPKHPSASRSGETPSGVRSTPSLEPASDLDGLVQSVSNIAISEQMMEPRHITIYTSNHNSSEVLRAPTQIVLTVTPLDQSKLFDSHTPIAWKVLEFPPTVNSAVESVWQPGIGFCTVQEKENKVLATALRTHVPFRSLVQLRHGNSGYSWSRSQKLDRCLKEEVTARNSTPTPVAIVLCSVEGIADRNRKWTFDPFLHCGVIEPGGSVTVGPPVMLQAYAVSGYKQNQLLSAKDKGEYILDSWPEGNPEPIDVRTLRKYTSFLLYTDDGGRVVLSRTWSSEVPASQRERT